MTWLCVIFAFVTGYLLGERRAAARPEQERRPDPADVNDDRADAPQQWVH